MKEVKLLKDCIVEYRKAHKELDDKLNEAEESNRQRQREQAEQSSH